MLRIEAHASSSPHWTQLKHRRFITPIDQFLLNHLMKKITPRNWIEMILLHSSGYCRVSTPRAFKFQTPLSPSLLFSATNSKSRSAIARASSGFAANSDSNDGGEPRANYAGVQLEEIVDNRIGSGKPRLDSWISTRINGISRARVQSSIKSGLVHVNGRVVNKVKR